LVLRGSAARGVKSVAVHLRCAQARCFTAPALAGRDSAKVLAIESRDRGADRLAATFGPTFTRANEQRAVAQ
jgi:hypothetical protein